MPEVEERKLTSRSATEENQDDKRDQTLALLEENRDEKLEVLVQKPENNEPKVESVE